MNPIFIPESPKNDSFNKISEEEILEAFFPENVINMEMNDIMDENYLFCLNSRKSKEIIQNNNDIKNKPHEMNENELLKFEDYETFYNKFCGLNEIEIADWEIEYSAPIIQYEIDQKLNFLPIEDENIIKIENEGFNVTKKCKEKILSVQKVKKDIEINDKGKISDKNNNKNKKSPVYLIKKTKKISRKRKRKIQIDINDKYFPFHKGKGLFSIFNPEDESLTTENKNINNIYLQNQVNSSSNKKGFNPSNFNYNGNIKKKENNKENGESKEKYKEEKKDEESYKIDDKMNCLNDNFIFKFKIRKYFIASNGKKKIIKKNRKFKPDDIRKKIKSRFHKTLKNIINENLKKAGSKELFDFLPQCFIGDVSKKTNSKCFDLTYKELLSTNFLVELNKEGYRNCKVDSNKYNKNLKVLNYLENNPDICKRSGFDLIKDKKYKEILQIYFTSAQFENSLIKLKTEKESPAYIQEYILRAKTYVNFYSKFTKNDNEREENSDSEEDKEEANDNIDY